MESTRFTTAVAQTIFSFMVLPVKLVLFVLSKFKYIFRLWSWNWMIWDCHASTPRWKSAWQILKCGRRSAEDTGIEIRIMFLCARRWKSWTAHKHKKHELKFPCFRKNAVESAVAEAAFADSVQYLDDAVLGRQNWPRISLHAIRVPAGTTNLRATSQATRRERKASL